MKTRGAQATTADQTPASASVVAGAARRDITPPLGIYARNWGAAAHDTAEGIHRPLVATVLAIREPHEGARWLVLASLDAGWWQGDEEENELRFGLIEALRLDADSVLIALTHTHAGPSLCRGDAEKPGGHLIGPYLDSVRAALIDATREAMAGAVPAVITWGAGRCDLATNRDLPDPERQRVVCGFNPDRPADDTVIVGRVTDAHHAPIATIVNYACHPTTLAWENRRLSPDFIGAMREVVEANTHGAPCLFLQGASGELSPREQYVGDLAVADRNGRHLGFAALAALEAMLPPGTALQYTGVVESGAPLATWSRSHFDPPSALRARKIDVPLPLRPLPGEAQVEQELRTCTDRTMAERLRRKLRVIRAVGSGSTCSMPAWVWRIGDAVLVAHPNEAYSNLQTELRRRFPGRTIAVANIVNGHSGYLAPSELYDLDIYQVWQSPFERGSLEVLIDTCAAGIEAVLAD